MNVSTLLLSSTAILIAGSSFAADLPASKAAPAAAVNNCSGAFGAGYFSIPGGDTCLKIGGYVRSDNKYTANTARGKAPYSLGFKYVLGFDAKSNSDVGTIGARASFYDSSLSMATESAYVTLGTFRAGYAPSNVDFNNAYNLSGLQYQPTGVGQMAYSFTSSGTTFTVAAESTTSTDSNSTTTLVASRPDLIVAVSTKLGDLAIKGGLVSHEIAASTTSTSQGFAALGRVDWAVGDAALKLGGGMANGAVGYLDNPSAYTAAQAMNGMDDSNSDGTGLSVATMGTGALEYKLAKHVIYGYAGQSNGSQNTTSYSQTNVGAGFRYNLASNFYIRPEIYQKVENKSGTTSTSNIFYLRIRRDF